VDIEFDPNKDRLNIAKHGISLAEAARLDWDEMEQKLDDSQYHGGEERWIGVAPYADGPLHTVVFVEIDDQTVRVISMWRSTQREFDDYVKQKGE
jgi:uncharacterized DUF497 family protein